MPFFNQESTLSNLLSEYCREGLRWIMLTTEHRKDFSLQVPIQDSLGGKGVSFYALQDNGAIYRVNVECVHEGYDACEGD